MQSAHGELSAARRITIHDRVSRALEEQLGTGPDVVNAIATHAWAASHLSREHGERAVTWRARAATMALARHAYEEALAWWRDVLGEVSPTSLEAALAHQGASTALLNLSQFDLAQQELDDAVRIATDLQNWDLVTELALTQASLGPWAWPRSGSSRKAFTAAIEQALPQVNPGARALLHVVLDVNRVASGQAEQCGADTQIALDLAHAIGHDYTLKLVLVFAITGTAGAWSPERRLGLVEELLERGPEGDMMCGALYLAGMVNWDNARAAAADDAMNRCSTLAAELGFGHLTLPLAWWAAARARDRDEPDADTLLEAALDLHRRSGSIELEDMECLVLARRDGGSRVGELGTCPEPESPAVGAIIAHALLEAGTPDLARKRLDAIFQPDWQDNGDIAARAFRLLVLASVGSDDEIRAALAPLEGLRGRAVSVGVIDHCGVVDHFLAAGYAAVGDPRAVEFARSAVEGNKALGCQPWVRRSAALLGSLTA